MAPECTDSHVRAMIYRAFECGRGRGFTIGQIPPERHQLL